MLIATLLFSAAGLPTALYSNVEPAGEIRCMVVEGEEGFIPKLVDELVSKVRSDSSTSDSLKDDLARALSMCSLDSRYRDLDSKEKALSLFATPIANEASKRLRDDNIETEKIDSILLANEVYHTPIEIAEDRRRDLINYLSNPEIKDRKTSGILLRLYIECQILIRKSPLSDGE